MVILMPDEFTSKQNFYLWKGAVKKNIPKLKELHETKGVAITTIHDVNKGTLEKYNSDTNDRAILNNQYHHVVGSIFMSNGLDGDDYAQLIISDVGSNDLLKNIVLSVDKNTKLDSSVAFPFGSNSEEQNAIFETIYKALEQSGKVTRLSGKEVDMLNNNWYANPNLRRDIHLTLNNQDDNFLNEFISYVEAKTGGEFSAEKNGSLGMYTKRFNGWRPAVRGSVGLGGAGVDCGYFINISGRLLAGRASETQLVNAGGDAPKNTSIDDITELKQGDKITYQGVQYEAKGKFLVATNYVQNK